MASKKKADLDDDPFLPTMEPKRDQKVHTAALNLVKKRDALGNAREEEKVAKQKLIDAMVEKELSHYKFGNVVVEIANENLLKKCAVVDKTEQNEEEEE